MAFSGTSITVENITGLPLSLGKAELAFGTWLIQPTDVTKPLEPKTFEVHSDINGKQPIVHNHQPGNAEH